jgi:hypothetical protein
MGRLLRSGKALVVAVVAVVLLLGAGAAFAVFPDTNVETYTGCLNIGGTSGGQVSQVAVGQIPLKPCGNNQRLVHFGGGDITKVVAGAGLSGGGDNGSVTLSLDAGHTLPQDCTTGQVAKSNGSNAWECGNDNDTTYTAGTGLNLSGNEFSVASDYQVKNGQSCSGGQFASGIDSSGALSCGSPATGAKAYAALESPETGIGIPNGTGSHDVVTLTVPAGTYSITAIGSGSEDADRVWEMTCYMNFGPPALTDPVSVASGDGQDFGAPLTMATVRTFATPTTMKVVCATSEPGVGAEHFVLQAVTVG